MNRSVVILGASVLVVGIVAGTLWHELRGEREQNADLRARVTELQSQLIAAAALSSMPQPQIPAQASATNPADSQMAAAPTQAPAAPEASAATAPPERARNRLASGITEMLASPEGRELARSQIRMMLPRQYPGLAKALNLTPEEEERLLDLLARQAADSTGDAMGLIAGRPTDRSAVEQMQQRALERQQANDAEIAAMLGGRHTQWQEFQATLATRQQVDRLSTALGRGDNALTEAQSQRLIASLAAEQARIDQETRDWSASGAGRNSPNLMEEQLQRTAEANRRLADVAAYHLNPQQQETYRRMQEQQTNAARVLLRSLGGRGQ